MNPAAQYIVNQPEPYRSILMHLQAVIEHTLPEVELKYKWRIPCYYINNKPICYLNASHKKAFVDVGFWHSAYLSKKYESYLVSENRKLVKSLRYKTLVDIEDAVFIAILQEVYAHKDKSFYT
ncbi:DUF1801 domain-containing protein [Lacinutrix sp. C3R15]|uniref:DUF1801 domain-containing protein n=1 Tax=Flavobacteriaceae TaxID=49546 RepID=UPI001C093FAB|nr:MULTISPECIES: DUF1801 domain-containing protein [Flavobacteriaceae]MBU2939670.1 DUF1801 domain-containing protein [Lacinutrix sp. C3R15]MDO6622985.1 DUF1801 domain-containing protein [Oceanihabitans sp. 1_MG-2023]